MDELAKRFAEVAAQYAPTVVNATLSAARIEALSSLMTGGMSLLVAFTLYKIGGRFRRAAEGSVYDGDLWTFGAGVVWVISGIVACVGIWSFINPWTWTALTHPEIWVAKRAFGI